MDKYICSCCGGHINRATMICEYCGTRYKEEYDHFVRIETFRNPVQTLKSKITMEDEFLRENPEAYSRYMIERLARQFAECITPYMNLEYSFNNLTRQHEIDATIKIVEPVNKPTDFYKNL